MTHADWHVKSPLCVHFTRLVVRRNTELRIHDWRTPSDRSLSIICYKVKVNLKVFLSTTPQMRNVVVVEVTICAFTPKHLFQVKCQLHAQTTLPQRVPGTQWTGGRADLKEPLGTRWTEISERVQNMNPGGRDTSPTESNHCSLNDVYGYCM